jgi:FtsP/CotA-like multicopper oxidase with cupredoxin domain
MTIIMVAALSLLLTVGIASAQILPAPQTQVLLPGGTIPKFVEPLPVAGDISVVDATSGGTPAYNIHIREFQSQILPASFCGPSWVWGYLTDADVAAGGVRPSYLGPAVVAERGVPAYPTYTNELPLAGSMVQPLLPIDMTLDWANPTGIDCLPDPVTGDYTNPACGNLPSYTGPMPVATHLHGGEVGPAFDGGPDAWESPGGAITGPGFPGNTYTYHNEQQESTIWFHDHALGITRLNVYAGLAGVYPIIDPANPPLAPMPAFPQYDIPLIIQDRSFDTNCQIFYNLASNPQPNPTVHPFWIPEFIGDAIAVNGKTWPYLNVEPRQYRFRFVNGSNARFYDLSMNKGVKFIVIATDDGYLPNAVWTPNLIIGPGERYEVIVDFGGVKQRTNVVMFNAARTPFPGGARPTKNGTDTVMQFRVTVPFNGGIPDTAIAKGTAIRPTLLEPIINGFDPATGSITRQLTLNEVIGPGGPLELVVNNSKFNLANIIPGCTTPLCRETELPAVGDTEVWEIINITADAHPMHTHLTSFQILDRTPFQASPWINQYDALLFANGVFPGEGPPNQYSVKNADGAIGGNPAINSFLQLNKRALPLPYEMGWKDTAIMYPGEVTRIVIRWATTDTPTGTVAVGTNTYPFNPEALIGGVGYVWHCHIIDHEDNEMMRNYVVGGARQPVF